MSILLETGKCRCEIAPMGRAGLEGYNEKQLYLYAKLVNSTGNYYRIYHDPGYYETCGVGIFHEHFSIVKEHGKGLQKQL